MGLNNLIKFHLWSIKLLELIRFPPGIQSISSVHPFLINIWQCHVSNIWFYWHELPTWLSKSYSLLFAFQFKSNVLIAQLYNVVTQMENPHQNRICIFLSCLNLNMNTNTDVFLLLETTDTTEAKLTDVSLTINLKKHGYVKTKALPKQIFTYAFYMEGWQ